VIREACEHSWQAEAARDGRFSGFDRASFERHAATCAVCTREMRALAELETAFRSLPAQASSPLERRRARIELLRRANALAVHEPPRWSRRRLTVSALVATAAAALALAVFVLLRPARFHELHESIAAPTYRLKASEGADFALADRGATLRIDARHGRFELEVDRLKEGQRFLLTLPDGELEVQGTRFMVDLDRARTRSVQVTEGRVALRLRNHGPIVLSAGDRWPPIAARTPLAEPPLRAGPEPRAAGPASAPKPTAIVAHRATVASASSEPGAAPVPTAGSDFAAAMAAFSAGDFARAETLFTAFEARHPRDARIEDSMFLRSVARSRRGDTGGAQALARDYLRRYPKGLRRLEAERLAAEH
jgi:TolA-binding protein